MTMQITGETVLTPLIVVSFSEEGIKNAVGGGDFQSIVGGGDVFTFPGGHSNNFTKLTHTFNVNDVGWKIRLEMIDPVAEFEAKFLSMSMEDVLASPLFLSEGEVTSEVEQALIDIEKGNIPGGGVIDEVIKRSKAHRIWITYGVGNNLDDWAGPFAVYLTGAKLKVDTGNIKKLVLDFSPNLDPVTTPIGFRGKRDIPLDGLKNTAVGRVGPFKVGEGKPVGSEEYGGTGSVGNWHRWAEKTGVDTKDELNVFFQNFDVHATLMTCIRTMVRKATNCNNVITLFPNVNTYGVKAIATAISCDRETGIKHDEEKEQWLIDAADKVFSKFGAQLCVYELGKLISGDPKNKETLPTSYDKYIDMFKDCDSVREEYVKKAKYYVEMKSVTEVLNGHKAGINKKISKLREAIQNTLRGYHPQYHVESRPDIIAAFQGAPGVTGDGPICFYGDQALIRDIVYGKGDKSKKYLHPADQKLVGKGIVSTDPLPEFRMNMQSPNIISLDYLDDGGLYKGALLAGFTTNAKSKIAKVDAVLSEASEVYGNTELDHVIDSIVAAGSVSSPDVAKLLLAAEKHLTATEAKTTYELDPSMSNNPIGVLTSAYEQLHKTATNIVITTLPHFHLSDMSVQGLKCLVLGSMPQAMAPGNPPTPAKSGQDIENAFFNGVYYIIGFIHEISSTGIAKSKFVLKPITKRTAPAPPSPPAAAQSGGGYSL